MYRITRTTARGQFANDTCFLQWLNGPAASAAKLIKSVADPLNANPANSVSPAAAALAILAPPFGLAMAAYEVLVNGPNNDNDHYYYIWQQTKPVQTPTTAQCDVALVTQNGLNGWETQAEAEAVLNAEMTQSGAVQAMVKKANDNAVSPGNIAKGVAKDIANDLPGAPNPGGVVTWVAEALIFTGLAWLGLKYVQSKSR